MYVNSCFGWSERIAPLPLFLLNVLKNPSLFDLGFIYGWFGELSTLGFRGHFFLCALLCDFLLDNPTEYGKITPRPPEVPSTNVPGRAPARPSAEDEIPAWRAPAAEVPGADGAPQCPDCCPLALRVLLRGS